MGGDFYCAISGTTHMHHEDKIPRALLWGYDSDWLSGKGSVEDLRAIFQICGIAEDLDRSDEELHCPSVHVLEGLKLPTEDMGATKDCVLIAGFAPLLNSDSNPNTENPHTGFLTQAEPEGEFDIPAPGAKCIFNVAEEAEGCYAPVSPSDDEDEWHRIWYTPITGFYITFPAYCILATVAPQFHLDPSLLYRVIAGSPGESPRNALKRHKWLETPAEIEYGIIERTFGQFAEPLAVCGDGRVEYDWHDVQRWWARLLCCGEKSDEEILEEAWIGKGGLWVYKRPDRFPIAKTVAAPSLSDFSCETDSSESPPTALDNIPLEIIFLILAYLKLPGLLNFLSLNKRIRSNLLPHADEIAHRSMKAAEPWYLPCNPLPPTPDCGGREREEMDWWEEQWFSEGNINTGDSTEKVPWMKYWIQCKRDANMMNRRRIWRCAESVKELGVKLGLIT